MELSESDFEHTEPPRTVADPASKSTLQLPRAEDLAFKATVQLPRADDPAPLPTMQLPHAADPASKPTVQLPRAKAPEPAPPSGSPGGVESAKRPDLPAEPALAADAPPAASTYAEESLAPVPMERSYLVPVVVALTVLGLAGGAAYMTLDPSTLGASAPSEPRDNAAEPTSDATAPAHDADMGHDASSNVAAVVEASVVANTVKPKVAPVRPATKPVDRTKPPVKHPKH
jgi:hypothetical protein